MKKTFLFVIAIVLVFSFISCKSDKKTSDADVGEPITQTEPPIETAKYQNTITVSNGDELNVSASYSNEGETTAFELFKKLCVDNEIKYRDLDGYVNSIGGFDNSGDSGWVYFFNGEMPAVGPNDLIVKTGFDNIVEFKYMKYSEAFPEDE